MFSAIIIGGGPAGAMSAILLARAGWHVTLIEQHRFPRDKVCGECLSATGIDVLRRCGMDHLLSDAVRLSRAFLHPGQGDSIDLPLPREMWGISRQVMDQALLNAARDAGASVLQPCRCEAIESGPRVLVRDLASNEHQWLTADYVLLADGKRGLIESNPPPSGDLGIKTHFTHVDGPRDVIDLFGAEGFYGGLAPIEGNRWNAAFSVPAKMVRQFHGNLSAVFSAMMLQNDALAKRLAGAKRISPWLASPLPRYAPSHAWPEKVIPIGNAAAAMEPIGGEGMGLALRSAELAAQALIETASSDHPCRLAELPAQFARLWNLRRMVCRASARLVSMPTMADAVMPLVAANPFAASMVMRWAGK